MRGALHSLIVASGCCRIIPARAGSTIGKPATEICSRDHPRSCGEHRLQYSQFSLSMGSSPLVRGAPISFRMDAHAWWIIPARAGSTEQWALPSTCIPDHPRSCGEHLPNGRGPQFLRGSSPLVRGALRADCADMPRDGIIPARAGSTTHCSSGGPEGRDHPRSCGEHWMGRTNEDRAEGSSPLVRGALPHPEAVLDRQGIIPARAGSTSTATIGDSITRDHPRSCGEHTLFSSLSFRAQGSSPLVRGALADFVYVLNGKGIIPARAGSTCKGFMHHRHWRDHPRSCGEHRSATSRVRCATGSSPLVRGAPKYCDECGARVGIIPARAGSTVTSLASWRAGRDHPRSCGEHDWQKVSRFAGKGSSPLVRGARLIVFIGSYSSGIIPARAGSTAIPHVMQREAEDHPRSCGEHTHSPRRRRDF